MGPTGTYELVEVSGDCSVGTEPEGAVPFDSCVRTRAAQSTWNTNKFVTVEDNVGLRAKEYPCSNRDSTM